VPHLPKSDLNFLPVADILYDLVR